MTLSFRLQVSDEMLDMAKEIDNKWIKNDKRRNKYTLNILDNMVLHRAIRNAPRKTGTLERGIYYKVLGGKQLKVGVMGRASAYAAYMERGDYRPGAGTRAKGPQAGNQYMIRAITNSFSNFEAVIRKSYGFRR